MKKAIELALDNCTRHGDTDVFPFPIELHAFFDGRDKAMSLLKKLHANFEVRLKTMPMVHEKALAAVGYTGSRPATQIDPIWNIYMLALIIHIGNDIEGARVSKSKKVVYSYRFAPDDTEKHVFDRAVGWKEFQERSLELAGDSRFVLVTDISDFYPRIYHHRLENALQSATRDTSTVGRIMRLLKRLSKNASYGLPVGGPAARLLSELLLNRMDRLLLTRGVRFCRFADDYRVFADTREELYRHLVEFSEALSENEGLFLQKSKTRVMTSEEFVAVLGIAGVGVKAADDNAERKFMRLRLHFDPYSPTAEADYSNLKQEMSKFDIVGMLAGELQKTRIDQALTRRLIAAVQHLSAPAKSAGVLSLIDNIPVLYPVFPNIGIVLKSVIGDLDPETRARVFDVLRTLVREGSYIVRVPAHLAYAIRVLSRDPSEETDVALDRAFTRSTHTMIRRDIILAMARRKSAFWVSNQLKTFATSTPWERRAMVIASYSLGDEGKHWRGSVRDELSPTDILVKEWVAGKDLARWEIPL